MVELLAGWLFLCFTNAIGRGDDSEFWWYGCSCVAVCRDFKVVTFDWWPRRKGWFV